METSRKTNKMAATSDFVNETILEEKLLEIWPEHPCLYDVRSSAFKDRRKREEAIQTIAETLNMNGK